MRFKIGDKVKFRENILENEGLEISSDRFLVYEEHPEFRHGFLGLSEHYFKNFAEVAGIQKIKYGKIIYIVRFKDKEGGFTALGFKEEWLEPVKKSWREMYEPSS